MKPQMFTLAALFFTIVIQAQIPNPGFEAWENYVDGSTTFQKPDMWVGSLAYISGGGFSISQHNESYPPGSGQYAIKVTADSASGVKGVALSSDWPDPMTNWIPQPSFPLGFKPTSLNLYFKYFPVGGDTMLVQIYFYKNGNLLGMPQYQGYNIQVSSWTAMEIPLVFMNPTVPDSASILLMTGIYKQHTGSELIVDNISFNGFIGIDESAIPLEVLFNPNPADDVLMLNWPEGDDAYVWIYALDGKLVFEQTKANAAAINVSHLPEGVYLVKMQHKNAVTTERLVVRH